MSNTHIDNIRTIASELSDMSPKTQMEIVKKCKDICGEVADAIETEVANEIADETATLQAQITTNANNIATNTSNIATLESAVATNTSDIATNTNNIATNTNNIATNTSDIATINGTLDTKADLSNTNQEVVADTFNAKDSDYIYTEYGTGSIKNSTGRYASKIITLPTAFALNETCTLATTDDIPEIEANPSETATGTLSKVNINGTIYNVVSSGVLLSSIVDDSGNARFVEGNGINVYTNITSVYCKWSLSGTHIMFVLAGTLNSSDLAANDTLCEFVIPNWILNKIYPVWSNNIDNKTAYLREEGFANQNFNVYLVKNNDNIAIVTSQAYTIASSKTFRIQFDLLIDTD